MKDHNTPGYDPSAGIIQHQSEMLSFKFLVCFTLHERELKHSFSLHLYTVVI